MSVVCATCSDTHRMSVRNAAGDEVRWLCTACPVPCGECSRKGKNGGPGPYCAATPCGCACHEKKTAEDLQESRESV